METMRSSNVPLHEHAHRAVGMFAAALIVLAALAFFLYAQFVKQPVPLQSDVVSPPPKETNDTLGGTIYERASNPVVDALPETVAPVTNPLEGAYRNPFE